MTGGWITHALAPGVRVAVVPAPPSSAGPAEAAVERIWAEARARRPALFDGRVFSALKIEPDRIEGCWTNYRYVLAQIRDPSLFEALGVRSLAVNGVVEGPDGVLFGRRDARAVYQPGSWQCPPAGSVEARDGLEEAVDLRAQLRAELAEELGMPAEAVGGFRPLAAVEHPGSHVVDVGVALVTDWDGARIAAVHRRSGNAEYERLVSVARPRLAEQLAAWGEAVVQPARVFIASL